MVLRILAIGDLGDNILILKKISNSKIHLINFPRKQAELLTYSGEGLEFFDSLLISKQVKKIKKIKDDFDLCLVMSWAGARVAYLAGLNYIFYFTGGDIVTPPFEKNPKSPYLTTPVYNRNILERWFYKNVFDKAIACVAPFQEYFDPLKRYRHDAIRLDQMTVDTDIFKESVEPIKLSKNKFTFFSPQKIGKEKGYDIIFKALKLCKTDFEILQVEWFTERNEEEEKFNKKLMKQIPPQIKLIPLVKRSDIPRWYKFADCILGQMRAGIQSGIERDAAFCNCPIICYTDPSKPLILDGERKIPPFLPTNNDPSNLANLIDQIVESSKFREELATKENDWVKKLCDPKDVAEKWQEIFEKYHKIFPTINREESKLKIYFMNLFSNIVEKFYYKNKMKDKNIKGWGEAEYTKLTK